MGQVPIYGIIGDGRIARHIEHYFKLENIPFFSWSRKSTKTIQESLSDAEIILLLVSDIAIEKVIDEYPFLQNKKLVHFSGSHISSRAWGAHPLMTFANDLYNVELYRKIAFVTEEGKLFKDFFPKLSNPSYSIKIKDKNLYHAMCVLSGNFTTILWNKMFNTLENKLNIPREAAFPYLERVAENIKALGDNALTGPLVRRDIKTIKRNLDALKNDEFQSVYQSVADIYLPGENL